MIRTSLLALMLAGSASAAFAQAPDPHAGHTAPAPAQDHSVHQAPAAPAPRAPASDPHAGHAAPAASAAADPHAGHTMSGAPQAADPHAGHAMPMAPARTGADLAVGSASSPPVITDNAADRVYGADRMQRSRDILETEHGAARIAKLQADRLEWSPDGDHYSWEVEGWYGGDINRLAVKTEGEGASGDGVEAAEVQLLYSRAVGRYTDLQAGLRYDLEPSGRAYATVGFDTMLPYWFEAEGALFLSEDGDLLGRLEGSYDWRLTQRLILQPRAELEFAAQDVPGLGVGSGLSSGEVGVRLRYELRREFSPYIGVNYERSFGNTAELARSAGADVSSTRFVVGVRTWF